MNLAIQPTVRAMISESLGSVNSRISELTTRVDAVEAEPVGAVAEDPLFTTKGDLPVGTGTTPTTSQRLAAGADGAVLVADASAPGGLVYERRHFSHVIYGDSGVDAVWTNMPLAQALWLNSERHIRRVDLTNYRQCRLVIQKRAVAGAAASTLTVYYSTTFSTLVANYASIGVSSVQVAANGASTAVESAWVGLTALARADVYVALVGQGGDGALDPTFGFVEVQFR